MNYTVIPSEKEELERARQKLVSAAETLAELALHREPALMTAQGNFRNAAEEFQEICIAISGRQRPVSAQTPAP